MKAIITHRFLPKRLLSLALGSPLGQGAKVQDVPILSITDNKVLVKVRAIALNPIRLLRTRTSIPFHPATLVIISYDYTGEVTRVGKDSGQR